MSQPIRAAWIEILWAQIVIKKAVQSQPIRAAWIEILLRLHHRSFLSSQPIRAAWIEIRFALGNDIVQTVAAHSGCVD